MLTEDVDVSVGEDVAVCVAGVALDHHQVVAAARAAACRLLTT